MSSILLTGPAVEPLIARRRQIIPARRARRRRPAHCRPDRQRADARRRAGENGADFARLAHRARLLAASWAHCREAGAAQGAQCRAGLRLSRPAANNRHAGLRAGSRRFNAGFHALDHAGPRPDRGRHRARCHGRFRRCRGRRARTAAAGDPPAGRALVREPRPGGRRRQKHGAARRPSPH